MNALILILLGACSLWAEAVQYRLEPGDGKAINLEVEKTGLLRGKKHQLAFPKYSGTVTFDAAAPQNSKVEVMIDGRSAIVNDTWVNEKDRKRVLEQTLNDMLQVSKYPEMRFASTKVASAGGNRYQVEGTLTIRGIGKPVKLDVTFDPNTLDIKGTSMFKMTAYSLKPPSAALGTVGTKDEMTAIIDVRCRK